METTVPTVGRIVHFAVGPDDVRAMLITAVGELAGRVVVSGMVFRNDYNDKKLIQPMTEVTQVVYDNESKPGSWHWPPRV